MAHRICWSRRGGGDHVGFATLCGSVGDSSGDLNFFKHRYDSGGNLRLEVGSGARQSSLKHAKLNVGNGVERRPAVQRKPVLANGRLLAVQHTSGRNLFAKLVSSSEVRHATSLASLSSRAESTH
jgi:hypothetical protein